MVIVKLTSDDMGCALYINADKITAFYANAYGGTRVAAGNATYYVRESPQEVAQMLWREADHGNV